MGLTRFSSSLPLLLAELERVDLLLRVQVWRARQAYAAEPGAQALSISEDEVDTLIAHPVGAPRWATAPWPAPPEKVQAALDRLAAEIAARKAASLAPGAASR